jgi:hypothetical protein
MIFNLNLFDELFKKLTYKVFFPFLIVLKIDVFFGHDSPKINDNYIIFNIFNNIVGKID